MFKDITVLLNRTGDKKLVPFQDVSVKQIFLNNGLCLGHSNYNLCHKLNYWVIYVAKNGTAIDFLNTYFVVYSVVVYREFCYYFRFVVLSQ